MAEFFNFTVYPNLKFFFSLVALASLVFHLAFVWIGRLGPRGLKKIDYWWISLAMLGLVGAVSKGRIEAATFQAERSRVIAVAVLSDATDRFRVPVEKTRMYANIDSTKVTNEEYRSLLEQAAKAREWYVGVSSYLSTLDPDSIPNLNYDRIPPLEIEDEFFTWHAVELEERLTSYEEKVEELRDAEDQSRPRLYEKDLILAWPFLMGVALALRLTKTSGELRWRDV